MAHVHWQLSDGRTISAQVADGQNLMEAALAANVPGVVGECGGCLSCATCHVVVDAAWQDQVGPAEATESAMLDIVDGGPHAGSRLSCQILARAGLDGLLLHVPAGS